MLDKVDWAALVATARALGVGAELPEARPAGASEDDDLLVAVHQTLMGVEVVSGRMVCPRCAHEYVITDGIPNMLLHEDEV